MQKGGRGLRVVFLDVDGVLNSVRDYYSIDLATDSHFVLLKELVDRTGAKIVLSSSWRMGLSIRDGLVQRLAEYGLEIYDTTPVLYFEGRKRGDEIRAWLNEHEEVTNFVILDDESDMCEFTKTNLVKTNTNFGLKSIHIEKAVKILNA